VQRLGRILAVFVALTAVAGGQQPVQGFAEYCRALRYYADDRVDAAVAIIDSWSLPNLQRAIAMNPQCRGSASTAMIVALITDAAVRMHAGTVNRVRDFLSLAESHVRLITPEDLRDRRPAAVFRFQEDWFAVAGSLMLAWTDPMLASVFIDRGLRAFKDSARLHTLAGIAAEMRAHLTNANLHDRRIIDTMARSPLRVMLLNAENEFRRAAAIDSNALEARVHLGRVLYLRKELKEARDTLAPVAAMADAPERIQYLAHLFLGACAEFERDFQTARTEYEAALRAMPDVQTGYIALSVVEQMTGHEPRAREMMAAWASTPMREDSDPWAEYENGGFDATWLDALRAQVAQ